MKSAHIGKECIGNCRDAERNSTRGIWNLKWAWTRKVTLSVRVSCWWYSGQSWENSNCTYISCHQAISSKHTIKVDPESLICKYVSFKKASGPHSNQSASFYRESLWQTLLFKSLKDTRAARMRPTDSGQGDAVSRQPQGSDKGTELPNWSLHKGYLHKPNMVLSVRSGLNGMIN